MGVVINLPGDVQHYASIHDNILSITKRPFTDGSNVSYTWQTSTQMSVWHNYDDYADRSEPNARTSVHVITDEQPINPYDLVYTDYKKTLHTYEDSF